MKSTLLIINTRFIPNFGKRMIIKKRLATDYTNLHRLETTFGCFISVNFRKEICE